MPPPVEPGGEPPAPSRAIRAIFFVVRQPSWVARLAAGAGLLVFAAVLALLVVPAMAVAIIVFVAAATILALSARVRAFFQNPRSILMRSEGRRNVRVIPPRE